MVKNISIFTSYYDVKIIGYIILYKFIDKKGGRKSYISIDERG